MKNLKYFFAAALAVATVCVSCDKEDGNKPVAKPDVTEDIDGTDGAVTLVVDLAGDALTTTTTDIYFVGKYKDAAGNEYAWNPTPEGSLKMEKVSDTRYKVVLYPTELDSTVANESGSDVKIPCVIAGKATLQDTKSTWGYCWQYSTVAWEGDYELHAENSSEWRLVVGDKEELGGVVYVTVQAWNGDPTATDFKEATYAKIKCGANSWTFEDMAAVGGGVFESTVYTLPAAGEDGKINHGCNLDSDGNALSWYPQENIEGWSEDLVGKNVKYIYTSKTNVVSMKLAE